MADDKCLICSNRGFLSWDRICFQGCHWSIQFTNYISALSLEKTMNGYPKKEKKSGLRTIIKSFYSGYSDQVVGIKGSILKFPAQKELKKCFQRRNVKDEKSAKTVKHLHCLQA